MQHINISLFYISNVDDWWEFSEEAGDVDQVWSWFSELSWQEQHQVVGVSATSGLEYQEP